ncbi:MAG: phospholipid carrier-dependent glycosyltransferase, partial [Deltaproteobacteria bacterium]|nr:phospholipid carrier-dependent glycosyltransferase [Deltaproteobacteria bacterium]
MTRTSRWVWSVVALTGVAAVPRFWELGRKDFWTDEAMDVLIATGKCFWDRVAYYLPNLAFGEGIVLLTSAGASTTVLRVFPAVMSVLCVPLAVAIARLYRLGERESLVAGLLLAISPLQIVYAQEIRQYSAVAAYGLLAHLLIVAWMENGRRVAAIGWLLLTLVGSFTQGFLVFSAVHLGWIFLRAVFGPPDRRVAFRQVVAPLTAGALLFAVSVAASVVHTIVFRNHLMKVESYPGVTPFGMLEYLLGFLFVTPCLGACAVLLAAVGAWDWLRRRQALPLMLSIGFFVSTILAFRLFGSTKFSIRFWLPIQPFLVVLVVAGLGVLRRHRHGASLANLFVIAWVAFGALGIVRIHQRPGKDIAAYDVKRDV